MPDWFNITYLRDGSPIQQTAYRLLCETGVLECLAAYNAVLAGTIPLGIDVAGSDLDIICEQHDSAAFSNALCEHFGDYEAFHLHQTAWDGMAVVIGRFRYQGMPFEIFGQPKPVHQQNAYKHMVIEHRLLQLGGEEAKRAIRALKEQGYKTEPAFARYFQLEGDPYQTLLALAELDDDALYTALAGVL